MSTFPSVHFGTVSDAPFDWRSIPDDSKDDDEPLAETPKDVVAMLGFDPAVAGHAADALNAEERNDLDESDFAVPGKRKLPIENEKHVRLAWDLLDDTDGLTAGEKTEAKRRILAAAKSHGIDTKTWTGAQDSAPQPKGKTMPAAVNDPRLARLAAFIAPDADQKKLLAALDEAEAEAKKKAEDDDDEDDDEKKKAAEAKKDDDEKGAAMDAKIASAVEAARAQAERQIMDRMTATRTAEREVRPLVGDVVGMDSAPDVYRYAAKHLGIDIADVPDAALRAVVRAATANNTRAPSRAAMDAAAVSGFAERFPSVARIVRR